MARRKIPTTVYITPQQEQQLKALHAKTRVPVAEYIRQGIDLVLQKHRGHLPGQLDLYHEEFEFATDRDEELRRAALQKNPKL